MKCSPNPSHFTTLLDTAFKVLKNSEETSRVSVAETRAGKRKEQARQPGPYSPDPATSGNPSTPSSGRLVHCTTIMPALSDQDSPKSIGLYALSRTHIQSFKVGTLCKRSPLFCEGCQSPPKDLMLSSTLKKNKCPFVPGL